MANCTKRLECGPAELHSDAPCTPTSRKSLSLEAPQALMKLPDTASDTSFQQTSGRDCPSCVKPNFQPVSASSTTAAPCTASVDFLKLDMASSDLRQALKDLAKVKTPGAS